MVWVTEGNIVYLNNKMGELIERFGDEKINRYIDFYSDVPDVLSKFFSLCHFEINSLLKYMNGRINNGHYTADESRDLIYFIDEIKTVQSNLRDSQYNFTLIPDYTERLAECEEFLQSSGGSKIPHGFKKINLKENEPIFYLQSSISVARVDKKMTYPIKTIGGGSYASVHKYKDEYYNRFFAIKKAFKNLTDKEYERFRIEFEEMKKLNSPYVLEVYRFDEENHQYIMEYADDTLDSYISKNNSILNIRDRIGLVKQILRAFVYINNKGVLHRDVSTSNVLIKTYEGLNVIKVSDFGLVKRLESNLTSKNTEIKGSLNDPRLELLGFGNYEIRHETYALTRLIYFVMTGKKILGNFKSKEFELFIKKGISDNIDERYRNVEELQKAFIELKNF